MREDGGFAPVPSHNSNAPHSRRSNGGLTAPAPEQSRFDWSTASQLNSRYQFDSFVTGSESVCQRGGACSRRAPAKAYNPLFI